MALGGEGDVEPKFIELSGETSGQTRSLGALKVVGPKFVVLHPAPEHKVDRRQHRGRHRHNGLAWAPARLEPLKQGMQVRGFAPHRVPGALREHGLEPRRALRRRAERHLPALSSFSRHRPAQEIR